MDIGRRLLALDALVLGQTWEPLERVHWQRAMRWWVAGRIEVLETWQGAEVRTATASFPVPSVVRFFRSRRRDRLAVTFSKENLYLRDDGSCQYCGAVLTRREATFDHVVPRSRGGDVSWTNIVIACRPCNQRKGNRTPVEARMSLLKPPTRPPAGALAWLVPRADVIPANWRPYLGLL